MRLALLPALLSLLVASPALAEPPHEAVTDAPLESEKLVPRRDPMPSTRIAGITATSIGATLVGVGIGFAVAASDSVPGASCDEISGDTCSFGRSPNSSRDLDGQAETFSMLSAVGLGIGLTAVTTGIVLIAVPGGELEPSTASVRLDVGAGHLGLSGSF